MRRFTFLCVTLIFSILILKGIPPVQADYMQAVAFYNQRQYEKAIQELRPDLDKNPTWEFGHRLLGLCYLNLKNNALAATSLKRAVDLKSEAFSTYLGLGQAYFNMQKYDSCIAALNQGEPFASKEKDPETQKAKLYRLRGSAYYRLNNFNEAVKDLTRTLRISQSNWSDFTMLGIAYFNMDRLDEAIEALEKSNAMKPDQTSTMELLGKAYLKKGIEALSKEQFAAAMQQLQKAAGYDPKNGYIHYNLAETYIFEKKYPDAEKALNRAAALMPENPDVYGRLGLVYEKLKKLDSALDAYKKAESIEPSPSYKEAIKRVSQNKKLQ
jgi:tetratricopeptide (TPR) repeat protein